jgi:hypothetical protein
MKFKLPKRFTPVVFAFYMSAIMALLMCTVIVAINTGIHGNYLYRVFKAYELAMPIAFLVLQVVRPIVLKLVGATVSTT